MEAAGRDLDAAAAVAVMRRGRKGQQPLGVPDGPAEAERLHQEVEWHANMDWEGAARKPYGHAAEAGRIVLEAADAEVAAALQGSYLVEAPPSAGEVVPGRPADTARVRSLHVEAGLGYDPAQAVEEGAPARCRDGAEGEPELGTRHARNTSH